MSNKIQRTRIQNLGVWTEGGKHRQEQCSRDILCDHPTPEQFLPPQDTLILGQDVSLPPTTQSQDKEHQYAKSLPA